jgi:ABC-type nitrate/sulfonate/bicarbonate transport system substrate-binding protein
MFKRLAALSFLAFVLLAPLASQAADCRLAYNAKVHYAPQVIALQKGWYGDASSTIIGVDLGVSAGIAAAEALVSGSADVAVMGDVPALIALASARPCVLVASYGGGDGMHSVVVSEKSGIKTPKELAGRRLGVQFGSSTHGAISLYLKTHGLLDSVKLVNVKQNTLVEALITGDIDAFAASEPAPSLALKKVPGATRLTNLGGLGNQYPLMMVATKTFADAHPEALKVLVEGTRKAVDYINADPVNAGTDLSKATGISAQQEQNTLRMLTWKVALDEAVLSSLEQTAAFMHGIGKLKKMPDIRAAARPGFTR